MRSVPFRASRSLRLTALLVAVLTVPAVALVWLGVRLTRQDRALLRQQVIEQQATALRNVGQSLALSLARAEQEVVDGRASNDVVRFTIDVDGLHANPPGNLLWLAGAPALPEVADASLDQIERLEDGSDQTAALDAYRALTGDPSPVIRAGALAGLARMQRRARAWDAALDSYTALARVTDVSVAGAPADLQARRARCAVLIAAGRLDEALREAEALRADLLDGRWRLDRVGWELIASDLETWTGTSVARPALRAEFSATSDRIWSEQQGTWRAGNEASPDEPGIAVWTRPGPPVTAIAITTERLSTWLREATAAAGLPDSSTALHVGTHEPPAGPLATNPPSAVALPADTGLPWAVTLASLPDEARRWTGGQVLLLASLATLLLFVAGGGYAIARLIRREMAVARLQSEFVAAVSHEFRTPLASIRHLTDLLEESDDLPADRRRGFYGAVGRNAERLHRLVESLLDVSRMESGRATYALAPHDASALAAAVVRDFLADLATRGVTAHITVNAPAPALVEADAASLSLALWNLLDNAVKYSPDTPDIRVTIRGVSGTVTVSVRDRGYGIPKGELTEVFGRFARGAIATRAGIKGTGLGLAIVAHVAAGHGGRAGVRSTEGEGSEFEIVLPAGSATAAGVLPLASESR